jgi:hypothetical protein
MTIPYRSWKKRQQLKKKKEFKTYFFTIPIKNLKEIINIAKKKANKIQILNKLYLIFKFQHEFNFGSD